MTAKRGEKGKRTSGREGNREVRRQFIYRVSSPRVALKRRAVANRVHPILPMLLEVRSRISRLDKVGESWRERGYEL